MNNEPVVDIPPPGSFTEWFFPEYQRLACPLVTPIQLEEIQHQPHKVAQGFFDQLTPDQLKRSLNIIEGRMLIRDNALPPFFAGKSLLLWRSVARDATGNIFVPYIQNIVGQHPALPPRIYWWWLEYEIPARFSTYIFREIPIESE